MENLEEIIKKPKIRMFDVLLGTIPMVGLTALGITLTVYGVLKKENAAMGFGAAVMAAGAGFMGAYIYCVKNMLSENYKQHNEKLINNQYPPNSIPNN